MTARPSFVLALAIATALAGCATTPGTPTASRTRGNLVASDKATQLAHLYDQFWEEGLKLNPILEAASEAVFA